MADSEDVTQKLILDTTQAVDNVEKLILELGTLKNRQLELAASFKDGTITDEDYVTAIRTVNAEVKARTEILTNLTMAEQQDTEAIREKPPAYDAATQAIMNQIRAQESMREMLASTSPVIADVAGTGGEEGGGFAGMAGAILKAERAGVAIASGTGLARVGPMLGSITAALGMGTGAGLAAGGLLFALEGIIPKIKEFVTAWEMGVKPLDEAVAAIERLNRAQGEEREKRALKKIEGQITTLEDKEDTQGFLTPAEQQNLRKLREAAKAESDRLEMQKQEAARAAKESKTGEELEDIAAGAEIEENDPDQQYMIRHHRNMERRNAEIDARKEQAARRKRMEANLNRATNEGVTQAEQEDRLAEQEKRAADRAEVQRQKDAHTVDVMTTQAEAKQKRDEARAERMGTPLAVSRRTQREEQNEMLGVVQQNTQGFNPEQQRRIANQAVQNVSMGADLATAVNQAVYMTQIKIRDDFMKMMRQQSQSRFE